MDHIHGPLYGSYLTWHIRVAQCRMIVCTVGQFNDACYISDLTILGYLAGLSCHYYCS